MKDKGKPQKPKNMLATLKKILKYIRKNNFLLFIALVVTIIGTIMQVYTPKILGNAITLIFEGAKDNTAINFEQVGIILLSVAAMYVGIFITSFLQQRIMVLISQKSTYALRNDLKVKMNKVPISYFDKNANGKLMSVATNDIDNIVNNLQQNLTDLISSAVLLVGFLFMMISISPLLTGIACLIIPGTIITMFLVTPTAKKYAKEYYKSLGELNTQIEETYQGFSIVKSFNNENKALQTFDPINEYMVKTGWKARFFGGMMMPAMSLIQNIIYILIAIIGSVNVVSGNIKIGNMTAFLQYSTQFSNPIMKLLQSWSNFIAMIASAERVFEMLEEEEVIEYNKKFPDCNKDFKVCFDKVKFGYKEDLLMKDFCMDVSEGQTVAIVGRTGSGKTTLINLLSRFYEIQDGTITIDGTDIRNMDTKNLRKKIGMVLQDAWLFSGTIYDNIKYGNENATEEQIYEASKCAYADDFISKLPNGYNTILSEDAENISQGQKQLITIARAFVSNPEILILDEATSNVDSRTELIIQSALKQLMKGRTSFVVAHRLSTIYNADCIFVIDNGNVVEKGTHEELLSKNTVYSEIYHSQFNQKIA